MGAAKTWVFFRQGMFYPLDVPAWDEWPEKHAAANPGTLRIEDAVGNVLWEAGETLLTNARQPKDPHHDQ